MMIIAEKLDIGFDGSEQKYIIARQFPETELIGTQDLYYEPV